MKLIKVFLLGLIGIILPVSLSAQTISGKLIDENSQPLPYANVVLLSLPDSSFVNGTISGEDGSFTLEATSRNQIVKISSIGYKTICKPISPANIGIVQLVSDTQLLSEVVVKGCRPVIKREIDRMVFNVESSPVAQGSSVMELLKQTPLVKVTDSSIGIIGKNSVKVMLNGKISYLDSNDLVQYLNSLQSDDISSIEVITTPPSKYDADGNGGLINIVTKRNPDEGWNGSAGISYIQRTYAGENANATVNYRSSKSLFSAKIRQSRYKGEVDEEYHILQANSAQQSMTSRADTYKNIGGNLFFEYRLSSQSTFGAVYDFSYGKDKIDIDNLLAELI